MAPTPKFKLPPRFRPWHRPGEFAIALLSLFAVLALAVYGVDPYACVALYFLVNFALVSWINRHKPSSTEVAIKYYQERTKDRQVSRSEMKAVEEMLIKISRYSPFIFFGTLGLCLYLIKQGYNAIAVGSLMPLTVLIFIFIMSRRKRR